MPPPVMRTALALLLAVASTAAADSLEERLEAKLQKPFAANAAWALSFADAKKLAAGKGKVIFAYFSRSYAPWPPCNAVEGGTLATPEFKKFSEGYVPYLNVMTRIEDREDDTLLFDLGGTEHPTFLFLDAQGEVLGRHDPGETSVRAFEETGAKVLRSLDLAKKADGGDEAAKIDLAILRCDLGVLDLFDLDEAVGDRDLTAEQQRAVATLRADATVADMIAVLRKGRDEGARKIATEEFLALHEKGAHPSRAAHRSVYWGLLADHAVGSKDAALLREAIEGLRAVLPEDAKRLAELAKALESLE